MEPYYKIFREKSIAFEHLTNGQDLPLALEGELKPGDRIILGEKTPTAANKPSSVGMRMF